MSREFRVRGLLGKGGFGAVYLADSPGAKRVAIKVMTPRPGREELKRFTRLRGRLTDEARALSVLRDRAMVSAEPPVFVESDDGAVRGLAIIMAYADGMPLGSFTGERRMPPRPAVEVGAEVARLLHRVLHEEVDGRPLRLMHRDLKPSNVLVSWTGEVTVVDFGSALFRGDLRSSATTRWEVPFSRGYSAPERLALESDPAADIYSLGKVLQHLLWGRSTPSANESDELLKLVAAMTRPDPCERPESLEVLEQLLNLAPRLRGPPLALWALDYVKRTADVEPAGFQTLLEVSQPPYWAQTVEAQLATLDASGDSHDIFGAIRFGVHVCAGRLFGSKAGSRLEIQTRTGEEACVVEIGAYGASLDQEQFECDLLPAAASGWRSHHGQRPLAVSDSGPAALVRFGTEIRVDATGKSGAWHWEAKPTDPSGRFGAGTLVDGILFKYTFPAGAPTLSRRVVPYLLQNLTSLSVPLHMDLDGDVVVVPPDTAPCAPGRYLRGILRDSLFHLYRSDGARTPVLKGERLEGVAGSLGHIVLRGELGRYGSIEAVLPFFEMEWGNSLAWGSLELTGNQLHLRDGVDLTMYCLRGRMWASWDGIRTEFRRLPVLRSEAGRARWAHLLLSNLVIERADALICNSLGEISGLTDPAAAALSAVLVQWEDGPLREFLDGSPVFRQMNRRVLGLGLAASAPSTAGEGLHFDPVPPGVMEEFEAEEGVKAKFNQENWERKGRMATMHFPGPRPDVVLVGADPAECEGTRFHLLGAPRPA